MSEAYAEMARRGAHAYSLWILRNAESEVGCSPEWAASFSRLATSTRPTAYTEETWDALLNNAADIAILWLPRIVSNGWTPRDVAALLPMLGGRKIGAIGMGDVTVQAIGGTRDKIFRRPSLTGAATWDLGRRAA